MEKSGLIQNDELIESVVIEKLSAGEPEEKVKQIYDECKEIRGSTSCETAFRVYECYIIKRKE